MTPRGRSALAILIASVFIIPFTSMVYVPEHAPAFATPSITRTFASSTITVSLAYPYAISDFGGSSGTYMATEVDFSEFPDPLYYRIAAKDSSDVWALHTINLDTCTQEWVGQSWYVNTTDGYLKLTTTFTDGGVDAAGDQLMRIYFNATCTNDIAYNGTSLIQYMGENSGADHVWWADYKYGDYEDGYYACGYASNPYRTARWGDGSWFMAISKFPETNPYSWEGGATETGWKMPTVNSQAVWAGDQEIIIKFAQPNTYPRQAPPMLHLMPDDYGAVGLEPGEKIIEVYDNETIFQEAAEVYGIERVLLHEQYFAWTGVQDPDYYWQPMNASVANVISKIQGWCHKYGMEFGLYFGWLHGTKWGSLGHYNESSAEAAVESFEAFKEVWGDSNVVDFYYFDSSIMDLTSAGDTREFSGTINFNLLDPIYKELKEDGMPIVYNAFQGQVWWADDFYLFPLKFEGSTPANMVSSYDDNVLGDTWTHTLNHAYYFWNGQALFEGLYGPYNATNATIVVELAYKWGATFDEPFGVWDIDGFMPIQPHTAFWPAYSNRTGSVPGTAGQSALLENATGIAAYVQTHLGQTTITMTECDSFADETTERYGVFVTYVAMDAGTTVLTVNMALPSQNGSHVIACRDLTTGEPVNVTATETYFTFTAESGHVYFVYDSWEEAFGAIFGVLVLMIGIMLMMTAVLGFMRRSSG